MKLRIYQKTAPGPVGTGVSADPGEFFVVDIDSDLGRSFADSCAPNMYARAVCVHDVEGVTVPDTLMENGSPVDPLPVLNGEIGVVAVVRRGKARIFKMESGRPGFMTAYGFQAAEDEKAKLAESCEACKDGECDTENCPTVEKPTATEPSVNSDTDATSDNDSDKDTGSK